jgi:N-acylneuraminate cytidylyltransferase
MNMIAIITARGGSKRIPRKNIKLFMGKPMLAYAIEAAINSGVFDEIMVSTDDLEIAKIASAYGAKVPFMRSEATSNDFATTNDVLREVIDEYKKRGKTFEEICCIYPCVPFLTGEILRLAYQTFKEKKADCLTPVVRYSFPIQRAFEINEQGFLQYREPENARKRSQDLQPMYHDVGMFYFYQSDKLTGSQVVHFEMDEQFVQDIDNESDWQLAEIKYKILQENEK